MLFTNRIKSENEYPCNRRKSDGWGGGAGTRNERGGVIKVREKKREKQVGTHWNKHTEGGLCLPQYTYTLQRRVHCSLLFALCWYIYTYTPIGKVSNALSSHLQD